MGCGSGGCGAFDITISVQSAVGCKSEILPPLALSRGRLQARRFRLGTRVFLTSLAMDTTFPQHARCLTLEQSFPAPVQTCPPNLKMQNLSSVPVGKHRHSICTDRPSDKAQEASSAQIQPQRSAVQKPVGADGGKGVVMAAKSQIKAGLAVVSGVSPSPARKSLMLALRGIVSVGSRGPSKGGLGLRVQGHVPR